METEFYFKILGGFRSKSQDSESFSFIFPIARVFNNYQVQARHQKESVVFWICKEASKQNILITNEIVIYIAQAHTYPQKNFMINQNVFVIVITRWLSK